MADVIQDIGVFNVKDELVFVDDVFCIKFEEEILIESGENGCESNASRSSSYDCSDSLTISEHFGPDSNYEDTSDLNSKIDEQNAFKFNSDIRCTSESIQSTSSEEFDSDKLNALPQRQKENFVSHVEEDSQSDVIEERTENSGKRTWACKQCDKTFISRKGSIIHLRTHTGERPFTCKVCSKRFIDSSTLVKHQVIHQETRPFSCAICHRGFNQKVALQRHESTHSLQPLFTCKYCPKTFLVRSSLHAHENIHSRIKPYLCGFCPSRFHTFTLQKQHERVHTNERPYQCNFCPKAFKDSGTLFKHQVIHSGVKPYCCPLCSNRFTQKVAVRKHIRSHVLKYLSNQCPICKITVENQDELCFHLEKHVLENSSLVLKLPSKQEHDLKGKINQPEGKLVESDLSDLATLCDVAISTSSSFPEVNPNSVRGRFGCFYCGMRYKRERTLHSHLTGVHLFCLLCNTKFYDRKDLEAHDCGKKVNYTTGFLCKGNSRQKFKSGNQQFHCEKCSKSFNSRNGFVIHQRSHTGERPYGCRWCDKAFGDSATRHKHERIHTGERPFKCSSCPRAFNQRAALRAHQVTHSCDRAFTCQHCPSSFLYATTLRKHIEACHADTLEVSCPLCFKKCPDSPSLHVHITESHDGKSQECAFCDSGIFTNSSEYCDHLVWHAKQRVLDVYIKSKNCKKIKGKSKFNSATLKERKYALN